ncbi:hypothetical protein [Bacillus cereus]|uniref:hypothetical protein n=1 Tax=Bacillus cereus TaxID=1396 RepID=UPI000BF642B0|nr:hypothetical protein [Bacillus cereus]PFM31002.1 hypothetical protein COJ43_28690 [Bacillus cereus]
MTLTYDILINFGESYISNYVNVELEGENMDELDMYAHAEICVQLLNKYCVIKQKQGRLVHFGCEGKDLTEEVKKIIIKH